MFKMYHNLSNLLDATKNAAQLTGYKEVFEFWNVYISSTVVM